MRIQKTADQIQRPPVIPVQLFAPMPHFFKQQRLYLADRGLAKVDDVHEGTDAV